MTTLKTKILETVKKNDITMIPKWKFLLYSVFGIIGLIFAFLLTIFVFSLALFVLSRYGFMYMPLFGFIEAIHAMRAIPVVLLMCTIVLLVIIETLSRYYSFSFRRPLAVTLLMLTTVVVIASFIISETPAHEYIRGYAKEHHIDIVTREYDRPAPPVQEGEDDVLRGEVIAMSPTTTMVELFDGSDVIAYATSSTHSTSIVPKIGDDVVIIGDFVGGKFQVAEIRTTPRTVFFGRMNKNHVPPMPYIDRIQGKIGTTTMMK